MASVAKSFPKIVFKDQEFTFEYLVPFAVNLNNHGPENRDLRVRVSYKSHVFSKSCRRDEIEFDLWDEGNRKRQFCTARFSQSQTLPNICKRLLETNAMTWVSKDKHQISNLAVIDGNLATGTHYLVIYYLFPSAQEDLDVEMVIKSAYEKYVDFSRIIPTRPIIDRWLPSFALRLI